MILKKIKIPIRFVGETNCYIITDEIQKESIVIDPAGNVDKIIENLENLDSKLKYIYLTHCHADHIMGVNELRQKKGGKVLIHRNGRENLKERVPILADYIGLPEIYLQEDSIVDKGDTLHIGDLKFEVIFTPGHTNDGTSLYCREKEMLFSGDTLFKGAWGRVDLPTGNFDDIMNSIIKKLLILPDETIVYPGHGKPTRIKDEKPIYLEAKPNID